MEGIDFNKLVDALENGEDNDVVSQLAQNPDLAKKISNLATKVKRTTTSAEKNQKLHQNAETITNILTSISDSLGNTYKDGECRVEAVFMIDNGTVELVTKVRERGNGTPVFLNEKGDHIEKTDFVGFGRNKYDKKNS